MIISEPAVSVMKMAGERWRRRVARLFGRTVSLAGEPDVADGGAMLPGSVDLFDAAGRATGLRFVAAARAAPAGNGMPLHADERGADTLSVAERKARAAAVRALMQVRDGRFAPARDLFAEAARLDPRLDLSTVPTFWDLPRGGQQAAVDGYDLAGRDDDALLLAAELDYTFRPKLVRRQPVGAAPGSPG